MQKQQFGMEFLCFS